MDGLQLAKPLPLQIAGIGRAVPSHALASSVLDSILDLPEGTIEAESGVKNRFVSVEGEEPTVLVQKAMRLALVDAHLTTEDLDMVLLASYPGTNRSHGSVTELGQALELREGVPVMELGTSGANGVSAVMTAAALLNTFPYLRRVAVVAVDQLTRGLAPCDMRRGASFGDGAVVVLLEGNPFKSGRLEQVTLKTSLSAKGIHFLGAGGVVRSKVANESAEGGQGVLNPEPASITRAQLAQTLHPEFLSSLKAQVAFQGPREDGGILVVPHQGSRFSLDWLKENFCSDMLGQVVDVLEEFGNQGVASCLFTLALAKEQGFLNSHSKVLLLSMSAGLTYGACLLDLKGRCAS